MPDSTYAAISVADALRLPVMRRGLPEVLAGAQTLDRPIRWVHAGEVPNIASLLSGGELLLTTGMGLGESRTMRRRYVAELGERGVAALAIELGDAFPSVPEEMRTAADAQQLPLIALHGEVPFVQVTEAIHTELINRQFAALRRGEEINRELIGLMLQGEGLPEVLHALAGLVGNPVFLDGPRGELLYHAGTSSELETWHKAGRRSTSAASVAEIPMGPRDGPGRLVVMPVRRAFDAADGAAVRAASGIVALTLLRAREEEELSARERGDLLDDLASSRLRGVDAARRAGLMGFAPRGSWLLPVAVDLGSAPRVATAAAWAHDTQTRLLALGMPALAGVGSRGRHLTLLLGLPEQGGREVLADRAVKAIRAVLPSERLDASPVVAVGRAAAWDTVGAELASAVETAICARALPAEAWHDTTRLEVQRLLWRLAGDDTLSTFVTRILGPVLYAERSSDRDLLATLRALCANGGRKADTARSLHITRQTLYHRLRRIGAILRVDLEDAETLLRIHLAVDALPFTADGSSPAQDAPGEAAG